MAIEFYQYADRGSSYTFTQLTAAGSTGSLKVLGVKSIIFQYVVATINTNVVTRCEGSMDDSNWFNLDFNDVDKTKTANGAYAFRYDGDGALPYIRFTWVSEAGGTAATLDVIAFGSKE